MDEIIVDGICGAPTGKVYSDDAYGTAIGIEAVKRINCISGDNLTRTGAGLRNADDGSAQVGVVIRTRCGQIPDGVVLDGVDPRGRANSGNLPVGGILVCVSVE